MTAGPEHDHDAQPGKPSMRTALQGSRRFAVMAGVVTLGVLAGAGVAVAATSSSGQPAALGASASPSPSPSAATPHFPPKGEWRMPEPGGGYQTVAFQNGKVIAVFSTSITLRSADGYSRSYQVISFIFVNAQQ